MPARTSQAPRDAYRIGICAAFVAHPHALLVLPAVPQFVRGNVERDIGQAVE
jgi:hypothetical protein